jgi:hypothetical protein
MMMMVVVMVMIYGRVLSLATQSDMTRTGWKLRDEDGEKKTRCAAPAPLFCCFSSLPYQDWGSRPQTMKLK